MKRTLKKGSSGIWVGYSDEGYSDNLTGRNFELEDNLRLTMDLSNNLRVTHKAENCYCDICELSEKHEKLKAIRIFDEQVIEGLGKSLQAGFALREVELIVEEHRTFGYSVLAITRASGGSIFLDVQIGTN